MRNSDKQAILEELRPVRRLERLCQSLRREVEILELEQEMQGKVREQLTRSQRDYVLREQLKVLRQELGEEGAGGDSEIAEYRQRIAKAKLPQEVADKLTKEVGRLEKQPFGSAEATVLRNYLDTVLELPWGKHTKERVNVEAARKVLDADVAAGSGGLAPPPGGGGLPAAAGGQAVGPRAEGTDPLSGGASRRGQDLHRHEHVAGLKP